RVCAASALTWITKAGASAMTAKGAIDTYGWPACCVPSEPMGCAWKSSRSLRIIASSMAVPSVEEIEGRHVAGPGDAVPKVDRQPRIPRPQAVTPATVLFAHRFGLPDRVHRERARPLEPDGIAGARVELEKRIAVARRAVAHAESLRERSRLPSEVSPFLEERIERGRAAHGYFGKRRYHAGRAVAPLHEHLRITSRFRRRGGRTPVRAIALLDSRRTERFRAAIEKDFAPFFG